MTEKDAGMTGDRSGLDFSIGRHGEDAVPGRSQLALSLGAYHGANPAMGWLFAVARGLQEGRRSALFQALLPIAVGHAASVILIVSVFSGAEMFTDPSILRPIGAGTLIVFGLYKLVRPWSHPRWVGMRVSLPELALWSFIMSTAHGAGLMLFPVLLGLPLAAHGEGHSPETGFALAVAIEGVVAVLLHTLAMFAVMAVIAFLVYDRLGLVILRQNWVNFGTI